MKIAFTNENLDALVLPKGKMQIKVWDTNLPGFGGVLGAKTFTFVARVYRDGKETQEKLGTREELTLPLAKKKFKAVMGQVAEGKVTPGDIRRLSTTGPTVREAIESYLVQMEHDKCRPSSISSVRRELLKGPHLRDWHDRPLRSIQPLEWRAKHVTIGKKGEASANRIMGNFSTVWNMVAEESMALGVSWPANASKLVRKYTIAPATDTIGWSALPAWRATLDLLSPARRVFNLLLLLTGLRCTDAYTLMWAHLNLTEEHKDFDGCITLPPFSMYRPFPKGGSPKAFIVPLPGYLVDLLLAIRAERLAPSPPTNVPTLLARWKREVQPDDCGWVFPSKADKTKECSYCAELGMPAHVKGEVTHLLSTNHMKADKAKKLGVKKLPNPHMLRHLYACANEEIGMPEGVAQALMNHRARTVTQRYRKQDIELLRHWQEKQCEFLLSRIRGERHLRSVA